VIRYTTHARRRMAERSIARQEVEAVVQSPVGPPSPGTGLGTIVLCGPTTRAGTLKVVVSAADPALVISMFRT
jgi:hypothetical protein